MYLTYMSIMYIVYILFHINSLNKIYYYIIERTYNHSFRNDSHYVKKPRTFLRLIIQKLVYTQTKTKKPLSLSLSTGQTVSYVRIPIVIQISAIIRSNNNYKRQFTARH